VTFESLNCTTLHKAFRERVPCWYCGEQKITSWRVHASPENTRWKNSVVPVAADRGRIDCKRKRRGRVGDHPRRDGCIPCPNQYVTAPVASQGGQHGPPVCLRGREERRWYYRWSARTVVTARATPTDERTYRTCVDNDRRKFIKPRGDDCTRRDIKMVAYITSHHTRVI